MSRDHSLPDQHFGGLSFPILHPHPESRLSKRDVTRSELVMGRRMHHDCQMAFLIAWCLFISALFSHHPTFGLVNGINFLIIVYKCPLDLAHGDLRI